MNELKQWIVQLRYPYTAGVIATLWLGTAGLLLLRSDAPVELLIAAVSISTIVIALIGFSPRR